MFLDKKTLYFLRLMLNGQLFALINTVKNPTQQVFLMEAISQIEELIDDQIVPIPNDLWKQKALMIQSGNHINKMFDRLKSN